MSIFLEHDDLRKSRRALVVTCFVVISLHYVQLNSNEISILGLEILIDKGSLLVAGKCVILYFSFMFVTLLYETRIGRLLERFNANKQSALHARQKLQEVSRREVNSAAQTGQDEIEEVNKDMEKIEMNISAIERSLQPLKLMSIAVSMTRDVIFPASLALVTVSDAHTTFALVATAAFR